MQVSEESWRVAKKAPASVTEWNLGLLWMYMGINGMRNIMKESESHQEFQNLVRLGRLSLQFWCQWIFSSEYGQESSNARYQVRNLVYTPLLSSGLQSCVVQLNLLYADI